MIVARNIMLFEEDNSIERLGEKAGCLFAYFLLTTILFYALTILNKVPKTRSYLYIMGIVIVMISIGSAIDRLLK